MLWKFLFLLIFDLYFHIRRPKYCRWPVLLGYFIKELLEIYGFPEIYKSPLSQIFEVATFSSEIYILNFFFSEGATWGAKNFFFFFFFWRSHSLIFLRSYSRSIDFMKKKIFFDFWFWGATFYFWIFYIFFYLIFIFISISADPNIAGDLCYSGILWMSYSRSMDSHKFHSRLWAKLLR